MLFQNVENRLCKNGFSSCCSFPNGVLSAKGTNHSSGIRCFKCEKSNFFFYLIFNFLLQIIYTTSVHIYKSNSTTALLRLPNNLSASLCVNSGLMQHQNIYVYTKGVYSDNTNANTVLIPPDRNIPAKKLFC